MALNYFVEDSLYDERMNTCRQCPSYGALGVCSECKCVMPVKAKFAHFYCPIKKWDRDYSKLVIIKSE